VCGFGGLQCRLDDGGEAGHYSVLPFQDVFHQTVKAGHPKLNHDM
jgi:hypothetical protein